MQPPIVHPRPEKPFHTLTAARASAELVHLTNQVRKHNMTPMKNQHAEKKPPGIIWISYFWVVNFFNQFLYN